MRRPARCVQRLVYMSNAWPKSYNSAMSWHWAVTTHQNGRGHMRSFEALIVAAALAGAPALAAQALPSLAVPRTNNPAAQCSGGTGGGSTLNDRVLAGTATSFDSTGTRLDAAMLIRGQPGWYQLGTGRTAPWPPSLPSRPGDKPQQLAGGSVDTFALVFDRANDIAWMGGRRVELHGANVVLLDRADGVGGPPEVVSVLRIDPQIGPPFAGCTRHGAVAYEEIREALLSNAVIRAFIMP